MKLKIIKLIIFSQLLAIYPIFASTYIETEKQDFDKGTKINVDTYTNPGNIKLATKWDFAYEGDIIPTQAQPPWDVRIEGGGGAYVTDGTLYLYTPADWGVAYCYSRGDGLDNSIGWTIEVRLKVTHSYRRIGHWDGLALCIADGKRRVNVEFLIDGIVLLSGWPWKIIGSYKMNTMDDFHIYRITGRGDDVYVYVDEILRIDATGASTWAATWKGIVFGDANNGPESGGAYWDYIRYRGDGMHPPDDNIYYSSGTFISAPFDAGELAMWDNISWIQEIPSGTSISLQTRTGNTPNPNDGTWSEWSSKYTNFENSPILSPSSRYIQYKVNLSTEDENKTPILKEVKIEYVKGIEIGIIPQQGVVTQQGKIGKVLWEKLKEIDIPQETNIATSIIGIDYIGKLYSDAILNSQFHQLINRDTTSFYISKEKLIVYFTPSKKVYKPNEPIEITINIENRDEVIKEALNLVAIADEEEIFTQTFDINPNEVKTFIVRYTSKRTFTFEVNVDNISISDQIIVEEPTIEVVVIAPDIVSHEPFNIVTLLKNTGKTDVTANMQIGADGVHPILIENIFLETGTSKIFENSFSITKDTVFNIVLSGDLERVLQKPIIFGEKIRITLQPDVVYPEGIVEIPYIIENIGLLNTRFVIEFRIENEEVRVKEYYLPKGEMIIDRLSFDLPAGDYILNYASVLAEGSTIIKVRKFNQIEIKEIAIQPPDVENQKLPIIITLENIGPNDFYGNLRLDTGFYIEEKVIELAKGETKLFEFLSNPPLNSGTYQVKVQILHNGEVIKESIKEFEIPPAEFIITQIPTGLVFNIGDVAEITLPIKNVSIVQGEAQVHLKALDLIDEVKTIWLLPKQEDNLTFTFAIPDDYATWSVNAVASILITKNEQRITLHEYDIPFRIVGLSIDVTAKLDKELYEVGEVAKLTLKIINQSPITNYRLFARATIMDYDKTIEFTLLDETTVEFNIPVKSYKPFFFALQPRIFYGIYHKDGRALYLSSIYFKIKQPEINLWTDKQVYEIGELVTVFIETTTAGNLRLYTIGGVEKEFTFTSPTTTSFTFTVPQVRAGTYSIYYYFNDIYNVHNFDVKGYQVFVKEFLLDKPVYNPQDKVKFTMRSEASHDIVANIKGWLFTPQGEYIEVYNKDVNLIKGVNRIDGSFNLSTLSCGIHRFIYAIYNKAPTIFLAAGSEAFDVKGVTLLSIATTKPEYRPDEDVIVKLETFGNIEAQMKFIVDSELVYSKSRTFSGYEMFDINIGKVAIAGTHILICKLISTAESSLTTTFNIRRIDTTPPVISQPYPTHSSYTKDTTPEISVRLSDDISGINPESIRFVVDGVELREYEYNYNTETGSLSYQVPIDKQLSEGPHTVIVNVSDYAGNQAEPLTFTFTVDITPPYVVSALPAPNSYLNDNTPLISITLKDTISEVNPASIILKLDEKQIQEFQTITHSIEVRYQVVEPLSDGLHKIELEAADLAGNYMQTFVVTFTVDTIPPQITITAPKDATCYKTENVPIGAYTITEVNPYEVKEEGWVNLPDGKYTYKVTAIDAAGNSGSAEVRYIVDNIPPVVTITTPVDGICYKEVPKGVYEVVELNQYTVSEEGLSNEEGTHTYKVTAVDCAGNLGIAQVIYIIDRTPPVVTITAPVNGKYYKDAPQGEYTIVEVNQYTVVEEGWSNEEGAHTYRVTVEDCAHNVGIAKVTYFVDKTPPVTEIIIGNPQYITDKTYLSPKTPITFNAYDPISNGVSAGVKQTYYRVDSGEFIVYRGTIYLSEGIHRIEYYSIDNVLNVERYNAITLYVDATPPVTELMVDGVQFISDEKIYINEHSKIVLTAIDPVVKEVASGVAYAYYRVDSGEWRVYSQPFTLSEGIHTIEYYSIDNVLNAERYNAITLYVDATPPVTEISIGSPQCTGYEYIVINSQTPITLTAQDPVSGNVSSGVKEIVYTINHTPYTIPGNKVTFTIPNTIPDGIITIEYYAIDNVTNNEQQTTKYVILDNSPPEVTFYSPYPETVVNGTITPVGKATDVHWGYYKLEYGQGEQPTNRLSKN